jgi:hypothetical protein
MQKPLSGDESMSRFVDVVLTEPPLWSSWLVVIFVCLFSVWLLARKIRPSEVIK